ncbi:ABC transporter permease, partial [Lysinibacillus xylanilyticus]
SDNDVILTNYGGYMAEMFPLEKDRDVVVTPGGPEVTKEETLHVKDVQHESIISGTVTSGPGGPIFVVSDALFEKLATYSSASEWHKQTSIKIKNKSDLGQAEKLYIQLNEENYSNFIQSYEEARKGNIETLGITIFTAAFLGLAFLMTTGSILYFKQMSEAEEERGSYTILRKIGFAEKDIMKGIYMKQTFNFGVPLIIGLLHSYFAVKSGWFLFGSELTAPLWIAMCCYIALYAIFAVLSVGYYKKVIRESL